MATWPASLPQSPLVNGFSRQKLQNRRSFEPEGGKSTHILFYSAVPEIMEVSFIMDESQRQTFNTFYENDTLFGTQPFTFKDPQTQNDVTVRFVGDPPDTQETGPFLVTISFELEILP